MKCPCHSSKEYAECCAPFHEGENPPTALALMRSRYSAYALGKSDYIITTTHPDHPDASLPPLQRRKQIEHFSKNTLFNGLDILDFIEGGEKATVTFKATLSQDGEDCSFTERSEFARLHGKWLYLRPLSIHRTQ